MTEWSRWFAWRPIKCGGVWLWFEVVERRTVYWYAGWYSEYRKPAM